MESDEDDYMSDKFINSIEDKRPGLVSRTVARNYKNEAVHKAKNKLRKTQSAKNLQIVQREEALKKEIPSDNKGFALLQKMGYKPGMGMGKEGQGRKDPVPIQLKLGRTGLGQETHAKRKLVEVAHIREKMRKKTTGEFAVSKKAQFRDREMRHDLYASQKVCEQLDSAQDITEPHQVFFWPELLLPAHMKPESAVRSDFSDDEQEERPDPGIFRKRAEVYFDEVAGEEEEEEEEVEYPVSDKLEMITTYLRTRYFYCIWCGTSYSDRDDLSTNCPGPSRQDHNS